MQMGLCKDYWFVVTMCTLMIPLPCKSRTRAFESTFGMCAAISGQNGTFGLLSHTSVDCTRNSCAFLLIISMMLAQVLREQLKCMLCTSDAEDCMGWGVIALIALSLGFTVNYLKRQMGNVCSSLYLIPTETHLVL